MRATKKVLAVDDNPVNLDVLREMLDDDYRVKFAHNGSEAVCIAKDFQPGIVLLDVMMPGMDGLDTCRQLRRVPGMADSVIIMVSAKAMPSEQAAGISAGADSYITKPFDEVELLAKLREYHDPRAKFADTTLSDEESDGQVLAVF